MELQLERRRWKGKMKEGRKIEGRKDVQAGWKDDGVTDGRAMIEMMKERKKMKEGRKDEQGRKDYK